MARATAAALLGSVLPMRTLVTGVAGFIGSTLAEMLLDRGDDVIGLDCFTDYYAKEAKEANLARCGQSDGFSFVEADLRTDDLSSLVADLDVVFHLAAQPGVRLSWSSGFPDYVSHNVLATQRLLEACIGRRLSRFVYASSSSIYGNNAAVPTPETGVPSPHSPYGVTKLAGEHLCGLYGANFDVPTISLRYFTVYGPRQRPDMAIRRLLDAATHQRPFPLFGDGRQIRDFTFVEDVARANLAAAASDVPPGSFFNVAGGGATRVSDLIELVGEVAGRPVPLDRQPVQPGDVAQTGGDVSEAKRHLGWEPLVELREGISMQLEWQRAMPPLDF